MSELSPVAQVLRSHDRDRFQTALFASPPARDALIALYAFDCELARIRHVVSQPMAGLIRLQWWRDALEGIAAGRPPGQPVARALHASWPLIAPHAATLEAAITARETELEPVPFSSAEDLARHLAATAGGIGRSAARMLDAEHAVQPAELVFQAWAIVGLVAEIEADRRQDRILLPADLLRAHGVDPAPAADLEQPLEAPVRRMADLAGQQLNEARRATAAPGDALPALLLAVPASAALRRLARRGYDHRSAWRRSSPLVPLRLLWHQARGRF